jgi:hypothetical protein
MLKVIFLSLLASISSVPAWATQDINDWVQFDTPYLFAAEMLANDTDIDFWALPIEDGKSGVSTVRAMLAAMQSTSHRENPLIIKIRLASVSYDYQDPLMPPDEFSDEVKLALRTDGMRSLALVRCSGYYSNVNTPVCFIDFERGDSLQKRHLEKGYLSLGVNPREVTPDAYAELKETENLARKAEIGIWVPFFFMKRSMGASPQFQ